MATPQVNKIAGFVDPSTTASKFNNQAFFVQQMLNKIETATIVKVIKCTNSGGLSPVGYVNIVPMVNQMTANDEGIPHPTIYNVPYMRMQGGANAVILDPKAGDIGVCVFSSRDISRVKNTRDYGNPASRRAYDMADALYLGGILNGAPEQYVRFSDTGVEIVSPQKVTITSPSVVVNGATTINGNTIINGTFSQSGGGASTMSGTLSTSGNITAGGISLQTHKHSGVTTGGSQTGTPV